MAKIDWGEIENRVREAVERCAPVYGLEHFVKMQTVKIYPVSQKRGFLSFGITYMTLDQKKWLKDAWERRFGHVKKNEVDQTSQL